MRDLGNGRRLLAVAAAVITSAVLAPSASAAPSFSGPTNVLVRTSPDNVAVGDFNGDGHQDMAVTDSGSLVTIRLGTGTGSFTAPTTNDFPSHGSAQGIVTGDFNGDGKLDLAVANAGTQDVSVLLGNGDGTFATHVDFGAGGAVTSIAVGDFNEDGNLDLAGTLSAADQVVVLLGNGSGSFAAGATPAVHAFPNNVQVADLDNDGHDDLVVSNSSSGDVSVLLGAGNGTFAGHVDYTMASGNVRGLAVGDFNGDGNDDVAVTAATAGTAVVRLGKGAGALDVANSFPIGNNPAKLTTVDVDRDGHLDLAATVQGDDEVAVLTGSGTGAFATPAGFSVLHAPLGIATADFNGDGRQDIAAVAVAAGNVSVLQNTTTTPSLTQLGSPNGFLGVTGFAPTDVAALSSNVYLGSPEGIVVLNRDPATGALTQAGCLNATGSGGCTQLHGLSGAVDGQLGISPDGKSVYLATGVALITLSRDTGTGALTDGGCIDQNGTAPCVANRSGASFVPDWVRVGPENGSVYAGPGPNQAGSQMSVFTRNTSTGALTQPSTSAGCVSVSGTDGGAGSCTQVDELSNETDIAFSRSGTRAWISSHESDTIVGFSRSTATGALTPLTGASRCVVDAQSSALEPACSSARALQSAGRLVRAGNNLYVTTNNATDDGLAEFFVRPSGRLAQLPGASGCLTTTGHDGETPQGSCTPARVTGSRGDLGDPREIAATPDGLDLYVEGDANGAVTTLTRDTTTGALSDVACLADNTNGATCTQGTSMSGLDGVAITPDGKNVYASTDSGVVSLTRHLRHSVTGSAAPSAGGSVAATSNSANASCSGSACTVEDGGAVTLTASTSTGYRFTGWTGACAGQGSTCTVSNVTSDQAPAATFVKRVTVTGAASPDGAGTITASSSSASADCSGATCTVDSGSSVTLTQIPAAGYRFNGWGGACAAFGQDCALQNVTTDASGTANYVRRYAVTGTASPAAGGNVIASSQALNSVCSGNTCSVDPGSQASLKPNPASGYKFTSWTGACAGQGETCSFPSINADTSATAQFAPLAGSTSTSGPSTTTASKKGDVKTGITVRCRVPCDLKGLAKVTVPKSVAGKRAGAARNVTVVVATLSKKLGAGKQAKIVMRLSRKGMKILRKVHKMRMKVAVTATAAGALPVKANRTLTVKAPKKRGH